MKFVFHISNFIKKTLLSKKLSFPIIIKASIHVIGLMFHVLLLKLDVKNIKIYFGQTVRFALLQLSLQVILKMQMHVMYQYKE